MSTIESVKLYSSDYSVTRLGNFWKFLDKKFLSKVAQIFVYFLGNLENHHVLIQTAVANFWPTFESILAAFISTSGHTVDH